MQLAIGVLSVSGLVGLLAPAADAHMQPAPYSCLDQACGSLPNGTGWWQGDAVGQNANGTACGITGSSNYVWSLQYQLVADHDYATTSWSNADGTWGPKTWAAVKAFQTKRGL